MLSPNQPHSPQGLETIKEEEDRKECYERDAVVWGHSHCTSEFTAAVVPTQDLHEVISVDHY